MTYGIGRHIANGIAAIGLVIVWILAVTFFQLIGWLAIGIIGLLVLFISVWLETLGGQAIADYHLGGEAVNMLARQMSQKDRFTRDEKLAAEAERDKWRRYHIVARAIGIALTAIGFGVFFLYEVQKPALEN
jgi:hypothetical protein